MTVNLYAKYLDRAEHAFARRDAQRMKRLQSPDPEARGWMREINERLNRMHVNAASVLGLPERRS